MSEEKKKADITDYGFKRNIDSDLWDKVQHLSKKDDGKIEAVNIIFKEQYKLPKDNIELIKKLAKGEQPKSVRLQITENLEKYGHIPFGMHKDLFKILSTDPDPDIKKALTKVSLHKIKTMLEVFNKIQPAVLTSSLNSLLQKQEEITKSLVPLSKIQTSKMVEQISQIQKTMGALNLNKIKIPEMSFNVDDMLLKDFRDFKPRGLSADAILTKAGETNSEIKETVELKNKIEEISKTLDDVSNQLKSLQKTAERNSKDAPTISTNTHKKRNSIVISILITVIVGFLFSPYFSNFIFPPVTEIHVTDLNAQDGIIEGNKFVYSYEPRSLTPNGTKNETFSLKVSNTGNADAHNFWIIMDSKPNGLWFDFHSSAIIDGGSQKSCQQKSSYCTIELIPKGFNSITFEYDVSFDHKLYQEIIDDTPKLFFRYGFDEGKEQKIEVDLKFN